MLGQLLREAGLLSAEDLEKALSAQLICGGKIGTSLIELEMVPINEVSRHLALQHNLPEATQAVLDQVSPEVLALVPQELCSRYKVVPVQLQGRLLQLAMLDPMDLAQVDELSFVTGLRIQPMVAPELRLYYLLERHFGLERPSRYLRVPEDDALPLDDALSLDEQSPERPQRRRYLAPMELPPMEPMEPEDDLDLNVDVDVDVDVDLSPEPLAPPPEPSPSPPSDEDLGLVYLDSFTDLPVIEDAPAETSPLEQALARLQQAGSQHAVAQALVRPVAGGSTLSVLFLVRGQALVGVAAHGDPCKADEVGDLVLSLTPRSALREAFERRVVIRASGQDPFLHLVASYLGALAPVEACVAPILAGQRVVQILCVLSAGGPLTRGAGDDLQRLCAAATERYAHLIRRMSR